MRKWVYSSLLLTFIAATPATAAWREASSQHFIIYSEQNPRVLQQFAEGLERYDKGLRTLFGVRDNQTSHASRVTIFVLPSRDAVRRLVPNSPTGVAGFYKNWPQGPAAFIPRSTGAGEEFGFDSQLVLQHEYAHHFLLQNFTAVFPAWFNEGFAEFAATTKREKDGAIGFGMAAQHRAYTLLEESPLAIEKLLASTVSLQPSGETERFYGRGWLLAHYLMVDPSRRAKLAAYLQRLNTGEESLAAARSVFGDLKELDKALNAYKRQNLSYFRVPASALPIGKVTVRDLNPGEAAMMDVRIQSKAGVNREEAARVVAMARKAATAYPNDAAVQTALAEAEFDAGNYAETQAAAERAIAADPKAIDALTYKGAARMRQIVMAAKDSPADWAEVRKSFLAANRLDPDDPEPLTYYFMSYIRQGIEPTPNAVAAAVRALELAPQDTGLRVIVIQYMLRHGKAAEARSALLRLASSPHGGELRDAAAAIMAALDSGGTEAALGVLRARRQGRPDQAESGATDES